MSGVRRVKGRHARALAGAAVSLPVVVRRLRLPAVMRLPSMVPLPSTVRRQQLAVAGAAGLGVTLAGALVAFAALLPSGSGAAAPKAAAVDVLGGRQAPVPAAVARPVHPARAGDQSVLAYYEIHDARHVAHVTQVIWTGPMLRVYTDLPASDADSKTAIALCETAAAYLEHENHIPMVFVHARRDAGYPVLANKMDARDDCRLNDVP